MGVILGGAAVGYAQGKGYLDRLPPLMGSRMVSLGVAGWAVQRYMKNPHLRLAGFAALAAASFDWGRVQGGGASGWDEY